MMMAHPGFSSDEWLTLQFAPLWTMCLRLPPIAFDHLDKDKGLVNEFSKRPIEAILGKFLEVCKKQEINPLVADAFYDCFIDLPEVLPRFSRDKRSSVKGLYEVFSLLSRKGSPADASLANIALQLLAGQSGLSTEWRFLQDATSHVASAYQAAVRGAGIPPSPPFASSNAAVAPIAVKLKMISRHLPVYLVVDASRHISDNAVFLEAAINTRLLSALQARPKGSAPFSLGLIPINDSSDLSIPHSPPDSFHASGIIGSGSCQFGHAPLALHADLGIQMVDSKPLVVILLAGAPDYAWQKPARQLHDLAQSGRVNVIAIGAGEASRLVALKEVGAAQPMKMADITKTNLDQVFDWLFGILDLILQGLESGASGKRGIPTPPACLTLIS
jgi:uncharacterized protein YegL